MDSRFRGNDGLFSGNPARREQIEMDSRLRGNDGLFCCRFGKPNRPEPPPKRIAPNRTSFETNRLRTANLEHAPIPPR